MKDREIGRERESERDRERETEGECVRQTKERDLCKSLYKRYRRSL